MTAIQFILLLVYAAICGFDACGPQLQFLTSKVVMGWILGLIFGDVKTGLYIGGTLQLMSMGVVGLAGASVPDYNVATLVAVPIAIVAGGKVDAGLAIGIPVAMLSVQLDILQKIASGFVAQWSQKYANKKQFKAMNNVLWLCVLMQILKFVVPVAIAVSLGVDVVNDLIAILPDWFMGGLNVAGKILPVVGISMLLNYMPAKKYINYLILGFVLYAYIGVPMLGVALVGFAMAFKFFKDEVEKANNVATVAGGLEDE